MLNVIPLRYDKTEKEPLAIWNRKHLDILENDIIIYLTLISDLLCVEILTNNIYYHKQLLRTHFPLAFSNLCR